MYLIILKRFNKHEHRILVSANSAKQAMEEVEKNWYEDAFTAYDFEVLEIQQGGLPKNRKDIPPMPASGASCL